MRSEETEHHRLGGSTTDRWFTCAYSVPASEKAKRDGIIPAEEEPSYPAQLGTAAHTLKEKCHETGCDPVDYIGVQIRVDGKPFDVDGHMIDNVTSAVEFCRNITNDINAEFVHPEFNSELGHLFDGEDIGGPCDYLAIGNGILFIDDYKNGQHPVEVENNRQFLLYAAGCYETFKDKYDIREVWLAVSQPNYNHHKGPNRLWVISVRELKRWMRRELRPAVKRVQRVTEIFKAGEYPTEPELLPNPSDKGCFWCPLNGCCKAYDEYKGKELQTEFIENESLPDPNLLTVEEAERIIEMESAVTKWFKEVREYRKHALQNGDTSTKYKLVESLSNREWRNEKRAIRKLYRQFKNTTPMYKPLELNSPAQMEKMLMKHCGMTGKDAKTFIDAMCKRDLRGYSMAPMKDGREQVLLDPVNDFAEELAASDNQKPSKRKRRHGNK